MTAIKVQERLLCSQCWQVRRHLTVSQKRSVRVETERTAGQAEHKCRVTSGMLCWSCSPPAACCKYGLTVWQEALVWAQRTKPNAGSSRWQGQPQQFSLTKPFLHAPNCLTHDRSFPPLVCHGYGYFLSSEVFQFSVSHQQCFSSACDQCVLDVQNSSALGLRGMMIK